MQFEKNALLGLPMMHLVITVAMLQTNLGAKPRLRVIYRINDVDNRNELECLDGDFIQSSRATFTFMEPRMGTEENRVMAEGGGYPFTIHPSNESLVTCTLDSEESDPVKVAAIPQYAAAVTGVRQYIYSDADIAEIECPFQLGRLSSLYKFSWGAVLDSGETFSPLTTNGSRGLYWVAEEMNRTLYVDILAVGSQKHFQCAGAVQTCTDSTLPCTTQRRTSPIITIINNINYTIITDCPVNVTVQEGEIAVFNCTATGTGDLNIHWDVCGNHYNWKTCSDSSNCDSVTNDKGIDGYVTSTLEITGTTNSTVTCVVNQNLTATSIRSSSESGIEIRLPHTRAVQKAAQLTVIPLITKAAISTATTQIHGPGISSKGSNPPLQIAQVKEIYNVIILCIVFTFIFVMILIFLVCICCILCYHYKNTNSIIGQKLRRIFTRNSMTQGQRSDYCDCPGDKTSTTDYENIDNLNNDISYQLQMPDSDVIVNIDQDRTNQALESQHGSIDATSTTCTDVRMQENAAYQHNTSFVFDSNPAYNMTNIALESATNRNVPY